MSEKKTAVGVFLNGLIKENPTFVQLLGMCPTLAVTTSLKNGIGMGLSATAVLIASNAIISVLRKIIPQKVRIAAYIVVIAAFVTMIQMALNAFLPELSNSLGIYFLSAHKSPIVMSVVLGKPLKGHSKQLGRHTSGTT